MMHDICISLVFHAEAFGKIAVLQWVTAASLSFCLWIREIKHILFVQGRLQLGGLGLNRNVMLQDRRFTY